jgi:hypothetical protein
LTQEKVKLEIHGHDPIIMERGSVSKNIEVTFNSGIEQMASVVFQPSPTVASDEL